MERSPAASRLLVVKRAALVVSAAAVVGLWLYASRLFELLVLTAPGAVAGVAFGWAMHAFDRAQYTWHTGLLAGLAGGVVLPPALVLLAMYWTVLGDVVMALALGAWIVLGLGLLVAVIRRIGAGRHQRRTRTVRIVALRNVGTRVGRGQRRASRRHRPDDPASTG